MNFEVLEPQRKKRKTNPSPSFSSLPNDILLNILARVSRSYYPRLAVVCKTFRTLLLSIEIHSARFHVGNGENILHVCLQLSDFLPPSWFSLWTNPDQTLTNDIGNKKKKKSTGKNTVLVPTRSSSYFPSEPIYVVRVGLEEYALTQDNAPSTVVLVRNKYVCLWRKTPNMNVARVRAVACLLDGKIYVMGGCETNESTHWGEVFDPNTQTWELLSDPGAEISCSSVRRIEVVRDKIYLRTTNEKNDYVYDPKEGKWDVSAKRLLMCVIDRVIYGYDKKRCLWLDTKRKEWRVVRGFAMLNNNIGGGFLEIAKYRGKLLILWDKFASRGRCCQYKNIWCAVVGLEKRNDGDEVWGNVEWASVVLTVPRSYLFLRGRVMSMY